MKKRFEYLLLLLGIFIISLNFISAAPTFSTVPANASLNYGDNNLSVNFNGTPINASFGNYSINNTGVNVVFSINQSGSNATLVNNAPLAAGNYSINVTINDSTNNLAWIIYRVQVNKSQEKCQVFFNISSPRIYPIAFSVWANCTSAFVLRSNTTTITNASAQVNLAVGAYNFSLSRNDTANYTYYYNDSEYLILPDTTLPTAAQNSTNNTEIGKPTLFSINVTDNSSLVSNATYGSGRYIFSINQTGEWVNDSAVNFTSTPSWANVTKTLNSTLGTFIGYKWFFNDTSFNTNSTIIYTLTTIADVTPPTYSGEAADTTYAGRAVGFTITVDDIIALETAGQYIFSTDNNGTWVNDTAVNFAETPEVPHSGRILNSTVGKVVSYRWFFTDNQSNTNSTPIYNLTTVHYPGSGSGSSSSGGGSSKKNNASIQKENNSDNSNSNNGNSNGIGQDLSQQIAEKRTEFKSGSFTTSLGQFLSVNEIVAGLLELRDGNTVVDTKLGLTKVENNGQSSVEVGLSNGNNAELKVMPSTASETALAKLKLSVCNAANSCTIKLKEVPGNSGKIEYNVQIDRHSKILGIFQKKMTVSAEVDAQTGNVISVHKPWWAFLATQPSE